MRWSDPSGHPLGRVERTMLRAFTLVALLMAAVVATLGLILGDAGVAARAIGPALIGAVAAIQMARNGAVFPAVAVSMVVVVVQTGFFADPTVFNNSMLGIVGLSVVVSLMSDRLVSAMATSAIAVAALLVGRLWLIDEPAADGILFGLVGMAVMVFVVWLVDWTRRETNTLVADLQEARQDLEGLVDAKDEFVASVSHELRTPLTAVIGLAEELRSDGVGIEEEEREELVSVIADQAVDVGHIVEDLLVAARADIGTVSVRATAVDVEKEIRRAVELIGSDSPPRVRIEGRVLALADEHRLRQILRNLLSNAVRYGGTNIEISATGGDEVVVAVTDNGPGIPDQLRDTVFEPYETAHRGATVPGSVGLGLSVSRQLARLMKGSLTYERVDGATVFRLSLPAA